MEQGVFAGAVELGGGADRGAAEEARWRRRWRRRFTWKRRRRCQIRVRVWRIDKVRVYRERVSHGDRETESGTGEGTGGEKDRMDSTQHNWKARPRFSFIRFLFG